MEEVFKWLPPTGLSRMARTARHYREVARNHQVMEFKFHDAVRRILRPRECHHLQSLLDRTGSFIWGLAAYEFFMREGVDWKRLGLDDGAPPVDVDIFLSGGVGHFEHAGAIPPRLAVLDEDPMDSFVEGQVEGYAVEGGDISDFDEQDLGERETLDLKGYDEYEENVLAECIDFSQIGANVCVVQGWDPRRGEATVGVWNTAVSPSY